MEERSVQIMEIIVFGGEVRKALVLDSVIIRALYFILRRLRLNTDFLEQVFPECIAVEIVACRI